MGGFSGDYPARRPERSSRPFNVPSPCKRQKRWKSSAGADIEERLVTGVGGDPQAVGERGRKYIAFERTGDASRDSSRSARARSRRRRR